MSGLEVETLLTDISPESPCGEDLSYDPAYSDLERSLQGTPEQQVGEQIIPSQEPNWREIREKSVALLGRSKDLRLVVDLALALMMTEGLPGLRDGLALVRQNWNVIRIPNTAGLGLAFAGAIGPLGASLISDGAALVAGANSLRPLTRASDSSSHFIEQHLLGESGLYEYFA